MMKARMFILVLTGLILCLTTALWAKDAEMEGLCGAVWRPEQPCRHGLSRHILSRDVALFDIYRGQPLAETDKSLAYRLALRDDERTLTDAELDDAVARVVRGLTDDLGARFRT